MKKMITILIALSVFALGSSNVWAQWGGSGYMNNGNSAFMDDTVQLRSDLAAKQAEYNALMVQKNPDPKRAAQLSREVSSLNEQIRTKAREFANNGSSYNNMPMRGNMMQMRGNMMPMHGGMMPMNNGYYPCW
jgi:hypothetical protein